MKVVRTIDDVRTTLAPIRGRDTVGFVPTMGALHEGHLSLIRAARGGSGVTVVSIFVNPLQFGPHEDLTRYPRDEQRDLELAEQEKADVVFLPSVEEMYPPGADVRVHAGRLGTILEGAVRPGHFDGVCTVVAKLFNIVSPDVACFGQKDAQQVAVIKRMVQDLSWPTRIEVCPIVRDADGLALSSRNAYLSAADRVRATILHASLQRGAEVARSGNDTAAIEAAMGEVLASERVEVDYARALDPDDFTPWAGGPLLLAVAARVGATRLIDNVLETAASRRKGDTR